MNFFPGDLVIPNLRGGVKKLLLWGNESDAGPHVVVAEVKKKTILTVIKFETFTDVKNKSDEWAHGACLLMDDNGRLGWTGTGWIKKLS